MSSHLLIHQKSYKTTLLGFLLACLGILNISLAQSLDTRPTLQELLLIKEQLTKQSMAGDHKELLTSYQRSSTKKLLKANSINF